MALDVPSRSYALPAGIDPAAVVDLVRERARVVVGEPAGSTVTVVDTADRRVRAAGADLRLEPVRGGQRLVLRDRPGHPPLVADVDRAHQLRLDDLPPGPLRDRLAPVVAVRALLPLVHLHVEVVPLRVLDDAEKTVVRLELTLPWATPLTDEGEVALAPRLEVAGVLGYPKPYRRIVRLLDGEAGLVEAGVPLADEAIAAVGGDPSGIRTRVRVPLCSGDPAPRAAAAVLAALADVAEANLPGVLDDLDPEFLHDLRVAIRRSRSVLREMRRAFPADDLARHRATLRWIQAATGPTRDLDVQLIEWDHLVDGLPDGRQATLRPVHELLLQRRTAAFREMRRELRSLHVFEAWRGYRTFLDGLADPAGGAPEGGGAPDAGRPVAEVAGRRIARVFRRMVSDGSAIDDDSPATALHELRKRGKELRYLLELFGGLWPSAVVMPLVDVLRSLQEVLGTHQDREVQAQRLRALAPELAGSAGGPGALLALGALVDRLDAEQRSARAAFAERFAAFAAPAQRRIVAETFGDGR